MSNVTLKARITAVILVLVLLLISLVSCTDSGDLKDISCEDIVSAYESAGYVVVHGEHKDESNSDHLCYIKAHKDDENNYIYFTTYFTAEQAEEAAERDEYSIVKWLLALPFGGSGWLNVRTYGTVEYTYFDSELVAPFAELIK